MKWHVLLARLGAFQSETSVFAALDSSEYNDLTLLPLTHYDRVHLTSVLIKVEVVRRAELDCLCARDLLGPLRQNRIRVVIEERCGAETGMATCLDPELLRGLLHLSCPLLLRRQFSLQLGFSAFFLLHLLTDYYRLNVLLMVVGLDRIA